MNSSKEEIYLKGSVGDLTPIRLSSKQKLNKEGICYACQIKHYPFCDRYVGCRNCLCAKEWHPLDGRCRVGPETEFSLHDCYCLGYVPLDNLEYLELEYSKLENKK